MKINISKITTLCILLLFSCAVNAKALDAAGVVKVYTEWCDAIGTAKGDSQMMIKYYAPHAILVPTLSNKILFNDNNGLSAYFKELTSNKNINCATKRLITEINSDHFATTTGYYTFTYEDQAGKTISVPARFTFAYKKYDGKWLIVQHHSSMMLP